MMQLFQWTSLASFLVLLAFVSVEARPELNLAERDIQRTSGVLQQQQQRPQETLAAADGETPVYASPFARPERLVAFERQESSHAPLNYAPATASARDLKASASYGHHHHGGHHNYGYDHSGWLDMGAWTGGKGSFGWYADYPVGKHGYGRK